jgi:putative hydrolase of the HAD superfamily
MPDPTDISLILFDLNGVLYRYHREARITFLAFLSHKTWDSIEAAIWKSGYEDSGDTGALDEAAYLRGFGEKIGYDLSEKQWLGALEVSIEPVLATLDLLPRIKAETKLAVLTNNNLLVRRHFATLFSDIAPLVGDRAHVSAEFGSRKPDPEVYRLCLRKLGVPPSSVLFVDDIAANVEGARQAGLQAFEFTGPSQLEAELRRRGLLN